MLTLAEKMVAIKTFKWLLITSDNRPGRPNAARELLACLPEKDRHDRHLITITKADLVNTYLIDASIELASALQLQSWVRELRPHPSQFGAYQIPISEDVPRMKIPRNIEKLKLAVSEMMLQKDVIKMTRREMYLYVVSTPRGIAYLSKVPFLGAPKRIE